jgi:hypothetical protein
MIAHATVFMRVNFFVWAVCLVTDKKTLSQQDCFSFAVAAHRILGLGWRDQEQGNENSSCTFGNRTRSTLQDGPVCAAQLAASPNGKLASALILRRDSLPWKFENWNSDIAKATSKIFATRWQDSLRSTATFLMNRKRLHHPLRESFRL